MIGVPNKDTKRNLSKKPLSLDEILDGIDGRREQAKKQAMTIRGPGIGKGRNRNSTPKGALI